MLLWQYIREYFGWVIALLGGIASICLAFLWALPETPPKVVNLWVASYICLIVAAVIVVYKMQRQLAARNVTKARLGQAGAQLARLSERERQAVGLLLIANRLTGPQLHAWLAAEVNMNRINQETTFLELDERTGYWSIHQEWRTVLEQIPLLPTTPQARNWSRWCKLYRHFLYAAMVILGQRRRTRTGRRPRR